MRFSTFSFKELNSTLFLKGKMARRYHSTKQSGQWQSARHALQPRSSKIVQKKPLYLGVHVCIYLAKPFVSSILLAHECTLGTTFGRGDACVNSNKSLQLISFIYFFQLKFHRLMQMLAAFDLCYILFSLLLFTLPQVSLQCVEGVRISNPDLRSRRFYRPALHTPS